MVRLHHPVAPSVRMKGVGSVGDAIVAKAEAHVIAAVAIARREIVLKVDARKIVRNAIPAAMNRVQSVRQNRRRPDQIKSVVVRRNRITKCGCTSVRGLLRA